MGTIARNKISHYWPWDWLWFVLVCRVESGQGKIQKWSAPIRGDCQSSWPQVLWTGTVRGGSRGTPRGHSSMHQNQKGNGGERVPGSVASCTGRMLLRDGQSRASTGRAQSLLDIGIAIERYDWNTESTRNHRQNLFTLVSGHSVGGREHAGHTEQVSEVIPEGTAFVWKVITTGPDPVPFLWSGPWFYFSINFRINSFSSFFWFLLAASLKSDGKLRDREYADMKSRLLLNLGLVYENLNDYDQCKQLLLDSIELTK